MLSLKNVYLRLLTWAAIALLLLCSACDKPYKAQYAQDAKSRLSSVVNALDRYAKKNKGLFPAHFDDLQKEGYLQQLPVNPYKQGLLRPVRMRRLKSGEKPSNGDFVYTPLETSGNLSQCRGYSLSLYGDARDVPAEPEFTAPEGVVAARLIEVITWTGSQSSVGRVVN
jgi:hypothetical protein